MSHWLDNVIDILSADSGNLRDLALLAGQDPKFYYKYQNLSQCDLRGQDLRGMNFYNCNLEKAKIDRNTKIDWEFDPREKHTNKYFNYFIPKKIDDLCKDFSKRIGYKYPAWGYRFILTRIEEEVSYKNNFEFIDTFLRENSNIEFLKRKKKYFGYHVTILTSWKQIQVIHEIDENYPEYDIASLSFLSIVRDHVDLDIISKENQFDLKFH